MMNSHDQSLGDDDEYFRNNPPPSDLSATASATKTFINHHKAASVDSAPRPVVLVTSGGTCVPLETNMVRFIDNFSAGTRGASSAEQFLNKGYAVIFLHREYSLLPFSRHYSHNPDGVLSYFQSSATSSDKDEVKVADAYREGMAGVLARYEEVRRRGTLLRLSFVTVNDYLWKLRTVATLMRSLESRALFYLAAAVSDFFIPAHRMVEHKIQSTDALASGHEAVSAVATQKPAARIDAGRLVIDLDPVPKFLKTLVDGWAPQGMIVSFKLETDPAILVQKARYALERYSHHLVIGNLLSTRKWEVVFVTARDGERWIRLPSRDGRAQDVSGDAKNDRGAVIEIESLIVPEVARLHFEHIATAHVAG